MNTALGLAVFLSTFAGALCGEYCKKYSYSSGYLYTSTSWCTYGCCGNYPNEYCCAVQVWIIVVGVIGAIIFLSCVIAVICCVVKQNGHRGQVVQPAGTTGVTTIAYNTGPGQHPGMQQPYGAGFQQPLHGQPGVPQPPGYAAPGASAPNPVYPPSANPAFPPASAPVTAKQM